MSVCAIAGSAAERPPVTVDKREFTLLKPTPKEFTRELSTDRPDFTESPLTVDAGHVQVELSFVEYARNGDGGGVDQYSVLPTNFKVGLLNQADMQFVIHPYQRGDADDLALFSGITFRL